MSTIDVLKRVDTATANNILAAAALATAPRPGLDDEADALVEQYQQQIDELLEGVRRELKLTPTDDSQKARTSIDRFLSKALERSVLTDDRAQIALQKVAQAGRLSPAAYKVIQPAPFRKRFFSLAVTKQQVDEAITQPDEYQHLMPEDALDNESDLFSLFMKRARRNSHAPNWMLVQSFRRGIEQVAQSAWRVYPNVVDLTSATCPLDVLKAFVEEFGIEISMSGVHSKFIESVTHFKPADLDEMTATVEIHHGPGDQDLFYSWSNRQTKDRTRYKVGLAYCIDMRKYRAMLLKQGASVR